MLPAERICFWIYIAVGPFAWLACGYFLMIGRERMHKLRTSRDVLPVNPPLISILIPAKDEGPRINACLSRVVGQNYPAIEVIAINDRSGDDTGASLDAAAACAHPSRPIRVEHIAELPAGWLGKCHALDAGAKHASGEWLFFVDSDVVLEEDALTRMAALAIARGYDALSILTTIETHRFVEKLMLPLLAGTWTSTFKADQTNEDSEPDLAVANGQVFLIRRTAYESVGGHAAVRDRIVEDVELARLLKKQGFKMRLMAGRHLARTRMHETLGHMFNAWARIFAGTSRGSVWPMVRTMGFIVLCGLSLFPAVLWAAKFGSTPWIAAVVTHAALLFGINGLVWRWSGNNPLYALLLPLSAPIELAILAYAVRKSVSGKIDWRGSAVDLRQSTRAVDKPA